MTEGPGDRREQSPGESRGGSRAESESSVVMYSTNWCGYCQRARNVFERKGVVFREIKLDDEPHQRPAMLQRTGGRRSVPQIFIGDLHVGGYDALAALDRSGELNRLLGLSP